MGLIACSSGEEQELTPGGQQREQDGRRMELELSAYATPQTDVTPTGARAMTRAEAWMPEGYVGYAAHQPIAAYFANGGSTEKGLFSYSTTTEKWYASAELQAGTTYQVYGYVPADDVASATIASSDYADGATLTLQGLNAVTPADVCVVVGAKESDEGLATGLFDFTPSGDNKKIYLLFDHLYAGIRFSFSVNASYDKLRTIQLRELQLKALSGGTVVYGKVDAVVTLTKTTDGTSPIEGVTFTFDERSGEASTLLYNTRAGEDPMTLTTTPSVFLGCFAPGMATGFTLVSTYDVLDKEGNMMREGCTAENTITLSKVLGDSRSTLRRGEIFTINLTVNPTYLYVLGNEDLDNPTVNEE